MAKEDWGGHPTSSKSMCVNKMMKVISSVTDHKVKPNVCILCIQVVLSGLLLSRVASKLSWNNGKEFSVTFGRINHRGVTNQKPKEGSVGWKKSRHSSIRVRHIHTQSWLKCKKREQSGNQIMSSWERMSQWKERLFRNSCPNLIKSAPNNHDSRIIIKIK